MWDICSASQQIHLNLIEFRLIRWLTVWETKNEMKIKLQLQNSNSDFNEISYDERKRIGLILKHINSSEIGLQGSKLGQLGYIFLKRYTFVTSNRFLKIIRFEKKLSFTKWNIIKIELTVLKCRFFFHLICVSPSKNLDCTKIVLRFSEK